jgi:uncharacterized membrane protein YdjX (TVP38/TMEM64 family)
MDGGMETRARAEGAPQAAAPGWPRWLMVAVLLLAVAGFYALGGQRYFSWNYLRSHLDTWQALVRQHLPLALAVFFLVYVAVTALSLPVAAALTLAAGALFGRWLGTAVVSIASTLGATLAFLSSRYLLRDWVQRRYGGRLGPVHQGFERDGAYYLFTLRLVPLVPYFLINLGMGLTRMRVRRFSLVSWVGMLPGTFLYVNAGAALAAVDEPGDIFSLKVLGALALLGITPLLIRKLLRWRGHG